MPLPVERLADHLFGGAHGQVGELAAELGDRLVALELDFAAGALQQELGVAPRLRARLLLDPVRGFLCLREQRLALPAGVFELLGDFLFGGGGALLRGVGGFQAFAHALRAPVEHLEHRPIEEEAQRHQHDEEVHHLQREQREIDA